MLESVEVHSIWSCGESIPFVYMTLCSLIGSTMRYKVAVYNRKYFWNKCVLPIVTSRSNIATLYLAPPLIIVHV